MDNESFKEAAKAARAVAETSGKAIELVTQLGEWLNQVFGKPIVNTVDLLWTDRVEARKLRASVYDYKNLVLLMREVEKELGKGPTRKIKVLPANS